ncbi:DUF1642 domain-containing protein [Streptococcus suis]|uniref:Phage protein n=1 Tax=Streptococcus suis TaxID=1307 RepID=A0A116LPS3_STRSU|nr:DUF1642 domain-containing protein [Streptococcus suis]NQH79298.1 DUF1642 domain-containing protein [Streptococcus suis]CYV04249.1 phage protein [Streptococcus suis]
MNKQEAIESIKKISDDLLEVKFVSLESVIDIVSQIHEPQTVVVPKFVAEWYERNKDDLNTAIYRTITKTYRKVNGENDDLLDAFEGWLVYEDNSILILIQMQLFGFEIEQEKLYTVEIPDPNCLDVVTFLCKENGKVFIGGDIFWDELPNYNWKKEPENQLTESEIKKDFEWAWQFREEVD